uniref:Uncharacterized protein LOC111104208 isoform X1 n=1 Tax=Crassostrea virginica TaxID=6565 RepID=A0A8B8ARR1_CRAVI|nr:uncharacterized protein LOC111104208 isoform X1 [Crassostrea virginica]XP_022293752.1 uncharacterized protein LOC111104208 isoform X1 [Crassostrea virginica]
MSDVVFGCFSCIAFIVIVLFNVGCFTPNWIRTEEISLTNFTNFTHTSTVSTTTRTCHHGLLYSIDCPNSKNGISLDAQQMSSSVMESYAHKFCAVDISLEYHLSSSNIIHCRVPSRVRVLFYDSAVFSGSLVLLNIAISVCFTAIPFVWCCMGCIRSDSDEARSACCSCVCTLFYAIGGLLGLVSIIMVGAEFDNGDLGWSFFLTVAAITIVLLQVVLVLAFCVCTRGSKEKFSIFMVYRRQHYDRF